MALLKSWARKYVRIKDEYVQDGRIITPNGMDTALRAYANEQLFVQMDVYGAEVYFTPNHEIDTDNVTLSHQIIVKESEYPYLWDAKYFRIVD